MSSKPDQSEIEVEHLRVKLIAGRTVRVIFRGPDPTRREIEKLILMLELIKDQFPV